MHSFRPLTQVDLPALLKFERHNRTYFEQWVPPRPLWFFNDPARFKSHMISLLEKQQSGEFLMYILTDRNNQILGRINLTVSTQSSLGYRIAQAHAGKGLATRAVQKICVITKNTLGLSEISAQAAQNNLASQRALLNNGFSRGQNVVQKVQLNGKPIYLEPFYKTL